MGFNKVYQSLMDIFPQVDSRMLKAVAIENSKDADAAAEIVLSEVIPFLAKKMSAARCSSQNQSPQVQANEDVDEEESIQLRKRKVLLQKMTCSSTEPISETNEVAIDTDAAADVDVDFHDALNTATTSKYHENNNEVADNKAGISEANEVIIDTDASNDVDFHDALNTETTSKYHENNNNEASDNETGEQILLGNPQENNSSTKDGSKEGEDEFMWGAHVSPITTADDSIPLLENTSSSGNLNADVNFGGPVDLNADLCRNNLFNSTVVEEENYVSLLLPSSSKKLVLEGSRAESDSEIDSLIHSTVSGIQVRVSVEPKSQQDSISEMGDIEDDSFNPDVSRSSQSCRTELLEGIIELAKNNKKTLFQAMQSVMNLMREVELKEEAAERAKMEAERGGLDILIKVEELKQMLSHAKDANDMHAGEVYGEKAILGTEVRELQSRLHFLSGERDKSLSILDEMRKSLETRQAVAEEVMKTAELEKLEKEEAAHNALAEQEAIMAKVVEESKMLQQEAEENSKLREFLMDRGQIVDSLQGEISVICEDVRLLKQNFDERIPLSKSISSSQTSCILASSGSSLKSTGNNHDLGLDEEETAKSLDSQSPPLSVDGQSPKGNTSHDISKPDSKDLYEDGWEIFDRDTEF